MEQSADTQGTQWESGGDVQGTRRKSGRGRGRSRLEWLLSGVPSQSMHVRGRQTTPGSTPMAQTTPAAASEGAMDDAQQVLEESPTRLC